MRFSSLIKVCTIASIAALSLAPVARSQSAAFSGFDTTTKGSWVNNYGQDGYIIANAVNAAPGYATVSLTGQSAWTWVASTTDVRALYSAASTASNRMASTYYSDSSFNIDVNLSDGQSHQIALYSLDLDTTSRSQTISVLNASTNAVLDTQTVSNFTGGVWSVWNVSGHVIFQVRNNSSSLNAVVSGIFFRTFGSVAKPSVTMNTPAQNPITGPVTLTATATAASPASISSVQFRLDGANLGSPVTSGSGSTYSFVWSNPSNGSHQLSAIATDSQGQSTTSGAVPVTVSIVSPTGASATFVKTDTTTRGSWNGVYGGDGYMIANSGSSQPSYGAITANSAPAYTWLSPSSDPRALVNGPGSSTRIASTYYTNGSFSFDVNFTDGQSHQLALYGLDYETNERTETITISDANSNAVIDTRSAAGMNGGVYFVWNVSGHVVVKVTYTGGLNAVISGLFVGGSGSTSVPAPTVTISTPAAGNVSGTVSVTSAPVSSIGISSVQYYLDGVALGAPVTTGPSYAYSWDSTTATNVGHTLTAIATDSALHAGSASTGVAVTVSNAPSVPPSVNITNPTTGSVSGSLTLQATATAGSASIASLTFAVDSQTISTVNGAGPYSANWNSGAVSNGSHTITATVTDSLGHTGAASVLVTVSNAASANSATFVKSDFATGGNWVGNYGGEGYLIANSGYSIPSYAAVTVSSSASPYTWASPSTDRRALYTSPSATTRLASTFYSSSSFSFDVNLTDSLSHQVALYCLDIEPGARTETITIKDATTNATLSTQALSNFNSGVYAVWNISGHVVITVTYTGGLNAVVSGLFFGGSGSVSAAPPTVSILTPAAGTVSNSVNVTSNPSSSVGIASVQYYLDNVALGSPVVAGPSYTYSWDTTTASNGSHTLTAIATDTQNQKSSASTGISVNVSNAVISLPSISITNPTGGSVSGSVNIQATATAVSPATMSSVQFLVDGQPLATVVGAGPSFSTSWNTAAATNASHTITAIATDSQSHTKSASVAVVVSNVVASSNTARFVKADITTSGSWVGAYGADGFIIANDVSAPPAYATVAMTGQSPYSWFPSTTDPRALLANTSGSSRIASAFYTDTSMNFDINLTDGQLHQIAFYCLDVDTTTRTQTVQVIDAVTNSVLDTQSIASFHNGVYLVWNVTGHVIVRVTSTNSLNAVVSGLFFRGFAGVSPPAITFSAPTNGQVLSGPVTMTANATSGQGIASVQFQVDGINVNAPLTGAGPMYTSHWASPRVSNGAHTISAIATDNLGLQTTVAVPVQVSNGSAPAASAILTSTDSYTSGSWKGVYGQDGEIIAVDSTNPPFYADVNFVNTIDPPFTWHAGNPTTDIPGLQKANSNERIGAAFYQIVPNATFNIDVNFIDYQQHELSLYFVDWHHNVRAQTITITDASTNAVLYSQYFTDFSLGIYYTFNIRGHVTINITLNQTPWNPDSAVVSGLFFQSASTAPRPTVSVTAPNPGQVLSQTVTLSATASSSIGMSQVQFELDGYAFGSPVTSGSPYLLQFNSTSIANGNHIINAIATDSSGHSITSAPINVTVSN